MIKVRQDAWSEEDDLLLAETVLRHVREGSTQLHAFEEVGDKLDRTSAAVGFRWNAIVRKRYEQALKIAKKQRKERQRALAKAQQAKPKGAVKQTAPLDEETYNPDEFFKTPYIERPMPQSSVYTSEFSSVHQPSTKNEITLDDCIQFLENIRQNGLSSGKLEDENNTLRRQTNELMQKNKELTDQLLKLEKEFKTVQEDYQALLQIMDRARRMVLLQDDTEPAQSFRMDKNGNLEKLAK
ncbi:RsfA family transcriptional regulator [Fictibacillus sp. Mic-4]|uniref:RsfA family transcriptional regulator n=1 Tax=Fictibacillus TaxID=1329200 RepID=UPI000428C3F3|nr:RsfA family transcriptional regulator [Fictibacillus gelatini]